MARFRDVGSVTLAVVLGLGLGACRVRRTAPAPPIRLAATLSSGGGAVLPQRWWHSLNDPVLSGMIERALAGNLGLRASWDRLAQAAAIARRAGAAVYPSVNGTASAAHTSALAPPRGERYTVGLAASYELDLWGRVRAGADAAALEAMATEHDVQTAALSLSAEVATVYYRVVELRGQLSLLRAQLETNKQLQALTELRFRRGKLGSQDLLRQHQLVESVHGERARILADIAVAEHALAVLLGAPPRTPLSAAMALPGLPPLPRTGALADLLRRRPDVRAAYRRVQAADQRAAAALRDRYPRFSISAFAGADTQSLGDLFSRWVSNLAANLLAPIFDGGSRAAEVDRTRAAAREAVHAYGQVLLGAVREVEDALARERHQVELLRSLARQLELSGQALARVQSLYANGADSYLVVLDALRTHQTLQRNQLAAQRDLVLFRIQLCRALAGSWPLAPPKPYAGSMGKDRS